MEQLGASSTFPAEREPQSERLLSVREVAEMLNVSVSWVYVQTEQRQIPFLKLGRYLRFRPSDIAAYVRDQQRGIEAR